MTKRFALNKAIACLLAIALILGLSGNYYQAEGSPCAICEPNPCECPEVVNDNSGEPEQTPPEEPTICEECGEPNPCECKEDDKKEEETGGEDCDKEIEECDCGDTGGEDDGEIPYSTDDGYNVGGGGDGWSSDDPPPPRGRSVETSNASSDTEKIISNFTKTVAPVDDKDAFRQYDVELSFTAEVSSSVTEEVVRTTTIAYRISYPGNYDNFITFMRDTADWAKNLWTNVVDAQASINQISTDLLDRRTNGNFNNLFLFHNNNNTLISSSQISFPAYFYWYAFELDSAGNPGRIVDNILVSCDLNVNTNSNIAFNGSNITANAFSPVVANILNIGTMVKQDGVEYMLINMVGFTDNTTGNPASRIISYVDVTTTDYDSVRIDDIDDSLLLPDSFELVPGSVNISSQNGNLSTITDFDALYSLNYNFKGESTITYRIQPKNAGTPSDTFKNGEKNLSGGDTTLNITPCNATQSSSTSSTFKSSTISEDFDIPPLFKLDLTIYAGENDEQNEENEGDGILSIINVGKTSKLTAHIDLLGNLLIGAYEIPDEWKVLYANLLVQYYDISNEQLLTGNPPNILSGYTPGSYTFKAMAKLAHYDPIASTKTVTLEVIGGKLIIKVVSESGNDIGLGVADVTVTGGTHPFTIAGKIDGEDKVYNGVANASAYSATAYVPYGYTTTSHGISGDEDSNVNYDENDYIIIITVEKVDKPFYRSNSDNGGG